MPPDQTVTVEVRVEEMPPVYGVELYFSFDPDLVEITALEHGHFLTDDPDNEAFVLANGLQSETVMGYALVLLNPAPVAQGNGQLVELTIRAKEKGQTTIRLDEVLFGTREGETVRPSVENDTIQIDIDPAAPTLVPTPPPPETAPLFSPPDNQLTAAQSDRPPLFLFGETTLQATLIVLGGLIIGGGLVWLFYARK